MLGVLLSCIIPYIIGGLYIKNITEDWLYGNYIEHANMMLESTAKNVDDTILNLMGNLSEMMAHDERIVNVKDELRTYTNFTVGAAIPEGTLVENNIKQYLQTIKNTQDIVTLVSFGTQWGGYVEVPTFQPTSAYDPRVRPWYVNALSAEGAFFTEPYRTKASNELVFAVSHQVKDNQNPIGVVSLTIRLDTLMHEINAGKYNKESYINILSSHDLFINSPKHSDWLLKSVSELNNPLFFNISQYDGKSYEGFIDGVESVLSVYVSPLSGWKYISVVKKSDVLKESTVLTGIFIVIYSITLLIIVILIYLISTYITQPILSIAQVINEMAAFKFNQYQSRGLKSYAHKSDEIGEITSALTKMQDNFVELNSNMNMMDEEIRNIDIYQQSGYQLRLSEDNPFVFIVQSFNELLGRVHLYIDQIKGFNQEMMEKNQLLIASEEELTAQLEEIKSQKELIRFLADHDSLTNLPNRRIFHDYLSKALERCGTGAVILLDLDNFKSINDTLGHAFGDKVLEYVARQLKETTSENTFVSRFGGDEFLILVEHPDDLKYVLRYVKNLQAVLGNRFLVDQHEVSIEFSVGISFYPQDSVDMHQLIMNADLALYHVKNSGKNNYAFFDKSMSDYLNAKREIKEALREAVQHDGFKLVYQPQVDTQTGKIMGYEALLRLKNNLFSPTEFIPVAEEDDMILTIGRLVTEMAIQQMKAWQQKGLKQKRVSINFSAVQIHDYQYPEFLMACLKAHGVAPEYITIEITENIFLENKESTITLLKHLRGKGISIAVDDFGTGYSSLSYLTVLPIDIIKLDRTLGTKFLEIENIAVMDSLIALAHSLNLKVVAEGIETHEQVKRLAVGKCDEIQGYYFSHPLEADDAGKNNDHIFQIW